MESRAIPDASRARHWQTFRILLVCVLLLGIVNFFVWSAYLEVDLVGRGVEQADPEAPERPSFDGYSDELKYTSVVPTLERPLLADKSALWCVTLAMAWQHLEQDFVKGPLEVAGAQETCRELTRTPSAELSPEHYYVTGGGPGTVARIRRELPKRFPDAPLDRFFSGLDSVYTAFAYLDVAIEYEFEFKYSEEPLQFKDSRGQQTPVHAFGIREKDKHKPPFGKQVEVLYREKGEFALDLSKQTQPYQIVLARMDRQATLKATLETLRKNIERGRNRGPLVEDAVVLVPSMHWKLDHRFAELEKPCSNFGGQIDWAYQYIHFKMDRKGAHLVSAATADWNNGHEADPNPDRYIFDRPFLVVMRKRGVQQPFFVMWVDNAELLQRHP